LPRDFIRFVLHGGCNRKAAASRRTPKDHGEGPMSLNIFLTICILGIDFMIYVLFQWACGDKRTAVARQVALSRKALNEESARPYLVASHHAPNEVTQAQWSTSAAAARDSSSDLRQHGSYRQRTA
jgi:hypothetical protein